MESVVYQVLKRAKKSYVLSLLLMPLIPLSWLFFLGVVIRRVVLTQRRKKRATKTPIVAIGNVVVGGSGKTPVLAFLMSQTSGKVGVVSRGYRRTLSGLHVGFGSDCDPERFGDEAAMLAARFPKACFAVSENKWEAILAIDGTCDIIFVDDGLQRYDIPFAKRIGVIDCSCPDGYGWLIPRGLLREPFSWLRQCDQFFVTQGSSLESVLAALKPFQKPIEEMTPCLTRFFRADRETSELPRAQRVALFAAIARPERFIRSMESLGFIVVDTLLFPDHGQIEIEVLRNWRDRLVGQYPDVFLVGTEKDWARSRNWGDLPVLFAEMNLQRNVDSSI